MRTRNVEWGWRIPCSHPGCNQVLERWADHGLGPPVLVNPTDDWALMSSGGGYEDRVYHAYCPEHAGPARDWSQRWRAWRDARREVGRTKWHSFLGMVSTTLARQWIGDAVKTWEAANPEPTPPWRS